MTNRNKQFTNSPINMHSAMTEAFPDVNYDVIPMTDQYDALEVYQAFADGALAEAPLALAAYVDHQQHFAQ